MSSVAVHVFERIKQYLHPTADHMTVVVEIANAIALHRETIPVQTLTTQETTDTRSTTSPDDAEPRASDEPIQGEGAGSARERADIRMGRSKRRGL